MARKTTDISIVEGERTLKFVITQMPAMQLHDFTLKVGLLLLDTNIATSMTSMEIVGQIGARLAQDGLAILRGLGFDSIKPLLNELLACCQRTDAGVLQACTPDILEGMIDDPGTIFKLEMEAAKLNFSFFSQMLASNNTTPEA